MSFNLIEDLQIDGLNAAAFMANAKGVFGEFGAVRALRDAARFLPWELPWEYQIALKLWFQHTQYTRNKEETR